MASPCSARIGSIPGPSRFFEIPSPGLNFGELDPAEGADLVIEHPVEAELLAHPGHFDVAERRGVFDSRKRTFVGGCQADERRSLLEIGFRDEVNAELIAGSAEASRDAGDGEAGEEGRRGGIDGGVGRQLGRGLLESALGEEHGREAARGAGEVAREVGSGLDNLLSPPPIWGGEEGWIVFVYTMGYTHEARNVTVGRRTQQ